jgi:hypothetical protein
LAAQFGQLVTQHHDLDVLLVSPAQAQDRELHGAARCPVQEAEHHERPRWRIDAPSGNLHPPPEAATMGFRSAHDLSTAGRVGAQLFGQVVEVREQLALAGLQGQRVEASSSTAFRFVSCLVLVGYASGEGLGKGQVRCHRLSSTVSVFALCEPRPQALVEGRWSEATCFSFWTVGSREGPIRSGPPC